MDSWDPGVIRLLLLYDTRNNPEFVRLDVPSDLKDISRLDAASSPVQDRLSIALPIVI
jgi:hypothetical protein